MKDNEIILSIEVDVNNNYENFIAKMQETGLIENYKLKQHPFPVNSLRDEIITHLVEEGLSSLLKFNVIMEDITSPSMAINDIEKVICAFVQRIAPASRLLVIDPYFYSANSSAKSHELFTRLISPLYPNLKDIFVISNNPSGPTCVAMHSELRAKGVQVTDRKSNQFHDRFWINPDNKKGLVIGTSLNGIGNKIALVDHLNNQDVSTLLNLAKAEGVSL